MQMRTCLLLLGLWCVTVVPAVHAQSSAVILLYHHVAENTPASTSVSPATFAEHLAYIDTHHEVVPLTAVVAALNGTQTLPDNAVAITFDDGYENILVNAHPLLQQYQFPYTVFINPGSIGVQGNQLSWEQVKQMQQEGVMFANHTLSHAHLLARLPGEDEVAWLARVLDDIERAEQMIAQHTGVSVKYLAYPFGEYNLALGAAVLDRGYIGFGQHSGAVGVLSDRAALPRFPAAGIYAKLSSLSPKMKSLAFPVRRSSVADPDNPPLAQGDWIDLHLDMSDEDVRLRDSQCFFSGQPITRELSAETLRFQLPRDLPIGRSRVNCTAPSNSKKGRFYWYSQPFFRADSDGRYPD